MVVLVIETFYWSCKIEKLISYVKLSYIALFDSYELICLNSLDNTKHLVYFDLKILLEVHMPIGILLYINLTKLITVVFMYLLFGESYIL